VQYRDWAHQLNQETDTWGFADVEAAMAAIPKWIESVNWQGLGANSNNLYVCGHSNGGKSSVVVLIHNFMFFSLYKDKAPGLR
jgi:carboxylesterase type B